MNPNQEEWIRWHERLNHIPCSQMRNISKCGVLLATLHKLNSPLIFPSYSFGGDKRQPWRIKGKHGHIKKSEYESHGILVCIDQLISS